MMKQKNKKKNLMMKHNNNENSIMTNDGDDNFHLHNAINVFFLNRLTNIVESANFPDLVYTYVIPPKEEQQSEKEKIDRLLLSAFYLLW